MATISIRMRRETHRKPIIDQHRMWRTEGILGLTWEPVMSTDMRARMATLWIGMRRNKHRKPLMDQRTMWRINGIVVESLKITLYISDL